MKGGVGDDEQVYRRIREKVGEQLCYCIEGGRTVFLHAAFNDPKKSPSVDRALLKPRGDPHISRQSVLDGIVSLQSIGIRRLGPISQMNEKKKPTGVKYDIDVRPDPMLGNCSHALIVMSPATAGNAAFKRLKEGLVRLANDAGWTVAPRSQLTRRPSDRLLDSLVCLVQRVRGG